MSRSQRMDVALLWKCLRTDRSVPLVYSKIWYVLVYISAKYLKFAHVHLHGLLTESPFGLEE